LELKELKIKVGASEKFKQVVFILLNDLTNNNWLICSRQVFIFRFVAYFDYHDFGFHDFDFDFHNFIFHNFIPHNFIFQS